ncbi:MAG: ABC transporter permease [Bacteroidota bacterium]
MRRYLIYRLSVLMLSLLIVSLLGFGLSAWSPIDPVVEKCRSKDGLDNYAGYQRCIDTARKQFGLDLPLFYVSLKSWAEPDSMYRFYPKERRKHLKALLYLHGDWDNVWAYQKAFEDFKAELLSKKAARKASYEERLQRSELQYLGQRLQRSLNPADIQQSLDSMAGPIHAQAGLTELVAPFDTLVQRWQVLQEPQGKWRTYLPSFVWHGSKNQYHRWMGGLITRFDLGESYYQYKSVGEIIKGLYFWSFVLGLSSILLIFLLGIASGVLAALYAQGWADRISGIFLWTLESLPGFWVATMLLVWPAAQWGWFPLKFDASPETLGEGIHQMILPVLGFSFGAIALVSRTLRGSLLEILNQDYIRTALAKGLSHSQVVWRHAFRNAIFPLIGFVAGIFPALIGGSVIIETIFNIPGMGREILNTSQTNDLPMVIGILLITGFLTAIGYLIADLLYAWADPRVRDRLLKPKNG